MIDPSAARAAVPVNTDAGLPLLIGPLRTDDRDLLMRGFEELSNEGRYKRFFTVMPVLKDPMLDRLMDVDQQSHLALGALDPAHDIATGGHGVGIARAISSTDDRTRAELAITIVDGYQRRGVGVTLVAALCSVSLSRGILILDADILATNRAMKGLILKLGATIDPVSDDPTIVRAHLPVGPPASRLPDDTRSALDDLVDLAADEL